MTADCLECFRKLVDEWHRNDWGLDEHDQLKDVATELRSYQREFGDLTDGRSPQSTKV